MFLRQEILEIDGFPRDLLFSGPLGWEVIENLLEEGIRLTGVDEHGYHRQLALRVLVDQVRHHRLVVAVLIHAGEPNAFLKQVFDHFPPQGTTETKVPGTTLNLGEFLPQHRGYYTFDGSLTTPPCTEHVRWFVLKSPVQASAAQVQQFAARYPHDARPVQALNDRTVKETRD